MHMEKRPTESATAGGGMGTCSFAAAGERMLVHPNSSFSTVCFGEPREPLKVPVFLWERTSTNGEIPLPRKRKLKNLISKLGLISETSGSGEEISGMKYPHVQVVRLKQWYGSARLNPLGLLPV